MKKDSKVREFQKNSILSLIYTIGNQDYSKNSIIKLISPFQIYTFPHPYIQPAITHLILSEKTS